MRFSRKIDPRLHVVTIEVIDQGWGVIGPILTSPHEPAELSCRRRDRTGVNEETMSDQAPRSREVFLSYSVKDKKWADAACAILEKHGLRCWIAPRDILPGSEWGSAIIGGIAACKIMVLIFSKEANASSHVRREVERAISKGMAVLPFRVEDVLPEGAMEYALGNTHWLDGFTPPLERQLEALAKAVEALIATESPIRPTVTPMSEATRPTVSPASEATRPTVLPMPATPRPKVAPLPAASHATGRRTVAAGIFAVAVAAIVAWNYASKLAVNWDASIPHEVTGPREPAPVADSVNRDKGSSYLRTQCENNLKLIGSAINDFERTNGHFPPAVQYGPDGRTAYSWRVAILPFMNAGDLYSEYKLDEPWNGPNNIKVLAKLPLAFREPGSRYNINSVTTNYVVPIGRHSIFPSKTNAFTYPPSVTDGTSNTIMIIESHIGVPWTKPEDLPVGDGLPIENIDSILIKLGGFHEGGFNAFFCNGSVKFIKKDVPGSVFGALLTRDGGEVVSAESYQ